MIKGVKIKRHFFTIGAILALTAVLFMVLGLPLAHPRLHRHIHYEGSLHHTDYAGPTFVADHEECMLCEYLAILKIVHSLEPSTLWIPHISSDSLFIETQLRPFSGISHISARSPPLFFSRSGLHHI